VRYLIDGYNLAHKITLPAGKVGPARLDAARSELLAMIAAAHGDAANTVTVVFDTKRTRNIEPEQVIHGIDVRFAIGEEADDMIERLIQAHTSPKQLTIVSDDHRLQTAGRRRACRILECSQYLDQLERKQRPAKTAANDADKPAVGDAAEWLAAFQDDRPNRPFSR
jgi:predicted RNA-binding protein with PIN domain